MPRAARLLKLRPAQVVVGSSSIVVELMRSAAVKVDSVRQLCIAWVDELLTRGEGSALETLMAEVPDDEVHRMVELNIRDLINLPRD